MKKTLLILAAIGAAIYFGGKALFAFGWRVGLFLCLVSPAAMALWLAYALNVLDWKIQTLWVMPPLVLLSLVVGIREFSWTEPLIKRR